MQAIPQEQSTRPPSWWRALLAPSGEQRRWLLRIEAWIAIAISYAIVIFAYAWPQDYRKTSFSYLSITWVAFMARTFLAHFGLFVCLITLAAALFRQKRMVIATLPLIAITLGPWLVSYLPKRTPVMSGETLTVMSVNLLASNRNTEPIIEEIQAADPDLLLLQEYTPEWDAAIRPRLHAGYPHGHYVPRNDCFGVALFSKRPLVAGADDNLMMGSADVPQVRTEIAIDGRHVAVYDIHLLPPRGFGAMRETRAQLADLLEMLGAEKLPVILAGDFNFTEASANADEIEALGLVDAHDSGGWGRNTTWPNLPWLWWFPSVRIDHIYLGGGLTSTNCRVGKGEGSDHRPVIARIGYSSRE